MDFFKADDFIYNILPFSEFKPMLLSGGNFPSPDSDYGRFFIEEAEKNIDYVPDALLLSQYRRFVDDGNRVIYEAPYFRRRTMLTQFAIAELCEKKGRFISKIMDIVYAICEESTWVIPAHNHKKINHHMAISSNMQHAPMAENGDRWVVDLFSAETAAHVAFVYYYFKDTFEKEIPQIFNERIKKELYERVVKPYLDNCDFWWMGFISGRQEVNNWNPWINSSVLATAAFAFEDEYIRKSVAAKTAKSINNYVNSLPADFGCDEGPSYWGASGGTLLSYCEILYDMTGGKYSVFETDVMRGVANYLPKVHIADTSYITNADCPPKAYGAGSLLRRLGRKLSDKELYSFGNEMVKKYGKNIVSNTHFPILKFYSVCDSEVDADAVYKASQKSCLPALQIAKIREGEDAYNGFCLCVKGGNNGENHNHLDVGEFLVYNNGKPLFVDMGVGVYTKFTFHPETRYDQLGIGTQYHNVAIIDGMGQGRTRKHSAENYTFEGNFVSMELAKVYDAKNLVSYNRKASLDGGIITVCDNVAFEQKGKAQFNFISVFEPESIGNNAFTVGDCTISFSKADDIATDKIVFNDTKLEKGWEQDGLYRITVTLTGEKIDLTTTITHK